MQMYETEPVSDPVTKIAASFSSCQEPIAGSHLKL